MREAGNHLSAFCYNLHIKMNLLTGRTNKTKYYCIAIILIGIALKLSFFNFIYYDYIYYLGPWSEYIKQNGFASLKDDFHNYAVGYIYILFLIVKSGIYPLFGIKIVSILFEFVAAFFIGKIAYLGCRNKNVVWLALAIIPLVPTVLINSAYQSQCDSIYASFVVASVYFALRNKLLPSMILLGLAFSFKAQAVIIMPFYFVYMLRGHIKWYYFTIVPLVYVLTVIPAWIAGRPILDLLTIYSSQASSYSGLVQGFANIYKIIENFVTFDMIYGILVVVAVTLVAGFALKNKSHVFTFETWVKLLFVTSIICPFLLPGMLERYMYLGDLFAILYILVIRKRIYLPIGIIFVSFYSYVRTIYIFSPDGSRTNQFFSFFESVPWEVVSLLFTSLVILAVFDFVKTLKGGQKKYNMIEAE